jgi:6-phosphofructokinase
MRETTLGHLQRGGVPVAYDRVLASQFGVKAFEMVLNQEYGKMVAYRHPNIISVPLEDAVRMASETPAHIMGISGRKGALSRGKDADVLILDEKLKVRCVWQMGRIIENSLFQ